MARYRGPGTGYRAPTVCGEKLTMTPPIGLLPISALPTLGQLPLPSGPGSLVIGSVLVAALLFYRRPPVTWSVLYALVPWLFAGSALYVLLLIDAYPPETAARLSMPGAYLAPFLLAGLAWVLLLELLPEGRVQGEIDRYLGAMGIGAVAVLFPVVVLAGGTVEFSRLVWLFTVPIVAGVVALVVVVLFGLWHPDAAAYAGFSGGLLVFGHMLDGLATVVGIMQFGTVDHTALSGFIQRTVETAPTVAQFGLDQQVVWPSLFVWTRLLLAIAIVGILAPYVRSRPTSGNVVVGLTAAAGLAPGMVVLLLIATGS